MRARLTAEELKETGVTAIGHPRRLLNAIGQREASLFGLVPPRKQRPRMQVVARLSATIRAFASALHRRRPNAPVSHLEPPNLTNRRVNPTVKS